MKKKGKTRELSGTPDHKYPPHRRESDVMDLLYKLTHNKRVMSSFTGGNIVSEKGDRTPSSISSRVDKQHSNVRVESNHASEASDEWYEELSDDHTRAFKQVFDMLDSAKTGVINADNLYDGLKRVDNEITRGEVDDVLKVLDKDGNGEIDFDEFLMHITAVNSSASKSSYSSKYTKRQRLFFSALRKFDRKSDLSRLQAKKAEQPHVLCHYTAGYRLIGLTDKQLMLKLKKVPRASKSVKSPYAKPLNFVTSCGDSETELRVVSKSERDLNKDMQTVVTSTTYKPKFSKTPSDDPQRSKEVSKSVRIVEGGDSKQGSTKKVGRRKHNGYIIPRTERDRVPLPLIKLGGRARRLTINDVSDIREGVKQVVNDYYSSLRKGFVKTACEHWEELHANHRGSKKGFENFTSVYRSYSPQKEMDAFVVCPWIPGLFRHVHHSHNSSRTTVEPDTRKSPDIITSIQRPYSAKY